MSLTVFCATCNRTETLRRTVDSYRDLTTPHELVLIDNGSTHSAALALLEELAARPEVRKVYTLGKVNSMDELTRNFNRAIRDQYRQGVRGLYAVTDADICFEGTAPDALDAYARLLTATGQPAGPHTRVDAGIPEGYPLRTRVLACESRLLYRERMRRAVGVYFSDDPIDTTFHLFPATREFRRLKMNTLRVGPPYDAMHLDWYVDVDRPTEENEVYIRDPHGVGSWGRAWLRDFWCWYQDDPELAFEQLYDEPRIDHDLCNNAFMLSWCYQYGRGCDVDIAESKQWLLEAIPASDTRFYWPFQQNWLRMIYDSDFSSLGWGDDAAAA